MTATFQKGHRVRVKAIWPFSGRRGEVVSADIYYVDVRIPRGKHRATRVLYRADELELVARAERKEP